MKKKTVLYFFEIKNRSINPIRSVNEVLAIQTIYINLNTNTFE